MGGRFCHPGNRADPCIIAKTRSQPSLAIPELNGPGVVKGAYSYEGGRCGICCS